MVRYMSKTEQAILIVLACLALLGLVLFIVSVIVPTRLRIAYYALNKRDVSRQDRLEIPALSQKLNVIPLQSGSLRILYFSDYHAAMMRVPLSILLNSMVKLRPDVVLFGGDLVSTKKDVKKGLSHLDMISSALAAEGIPFYGVFGNHDVVLDIEELELRGISMLRNQSTIIEGKNGIDYLLIGLDDGRTGKPDYNLALKQIVPKARQLQLKGRMDEIPAERTIVLAHNPDTALDLTANLQALVLSGHYHGGQINLPFKIGYRTLRSDQAWRQGFLEGLYQHKGFNFYISRGLGCVQFPLRFRSYPEITVFDMGLDPNNKT